MSLANFKVFSRWAISAAQERFAFNAALFNAATRGGFTLTSAANTGDYTDQALYKRIVGLVRRRDAYGTGDVTSKALEMIQETSVKVAAATPPVDIDPHWWQWIQRDPAEAGVVLGNQLAEEMLADMVAVAVKVYAAVMGNIAALTHDGTAAINSLSNLITAASKMGDRADQILCWVTHSKPIFDIYGTNLSNSANLFTYGTVKVIADPLGRPFVITDQPDLKVADGVSAGVDLYRTLGLSANAVVIQQNNDFLDNTETKNGKENITRTFQAQWSFNTALKGFAWDKTNGGKSPTNAALATASNWDQYVTENKDLAGVIVKSR